jgi:hypothetical protein
MESANTTGPAFAAKLPACGHSEALEFDAPALFRAGDA